MSPDYKKKINWYIRAFISLLTFVYLFFKIKTYPQLENLNLIITDLGYDQYLLLLIILFLVIPNWLLESIKWKILVDRIEKIGLKSSLRAVLGAISVSMLTPNRIGEIPGRAAFVSPGNRRKIIIVSAIGSLSQSIITIIVGFIAFFILKSKYGFEFISFEKIITFLITFITLCASIFFIIKIIRKKHLKYLKKLRKFFVFLLTYTKKEITNVQLISVTRYLIFITQFYLLLIIFKVDIGIVEGLSSISLTYLVLFITPFLTIAEIGVRGSASLLCIGYFSNNLAGILLAGFSLWIINLMIPALIGAISILKYRN